MTETQRDLVLHLLKEGDWQDAVIAYAEEMGVSNDEAREAVARLAMQSKVKLANGYRFWWIAAMASAICLAVGFLFVY